MTTFVFNQDDVQPFGDTSLTASPANPNIVFLNNSGVQGFAGGTIGTEYIVLGSSNVYGNFINQNGSKGYPWEAGDVIEVTISVTGPATYNIGSNLGYSKSGTLSGTGPQTIDTFRFTFGSSNEWFSFSGQGFRS